MVQIAMQLIRRRQQRNVETVTETVTTHARNRVFHAETKADATSTIVPALIPWKTTNSKFHLI